MAPSLPSSPGGGLPGKYRPSLTGGATGPPWLRWLCWESGFFQGLKPAHVLGKTGLMVWGVLGLFPNACGHINPGVLRSKPNCLVTWGGAVPLALSREYTAFAGLCWQLLLGCPRWIFQNQATGSLVSFCFPANSNWKPPARSQDPLFSP